MRPDTFAGMHPLVNATYFAAVIGFGMVLMHPAFLAASLVCAVVYAFRLYGRAVFKGMALVAPMALLTAALNPLFNHRGATILAFMPNGNPVTLESVAFGAGAATMLAAVITWFFCLNAVMTTDKWLFLFGKAWPVLSLLLSMALRFVPRFKAQAVAVSQAQRSITQEGGYRMLRKVRHGVRVLSILVTWSLENAIETADSMKHRGYGLPGRTTFSLFRFTRRDAVVLAFIMVTAALVLLAAALEWFRFRYFPTLLGFWTPPGAWVALGAYVTLCALPIMLVCRKGSVG